MKEIDPGQIGIYLAETIKKIDLDAMGFDSLEEKVSVFFTNLYLMTFTIEFLREKTSDYKAKIIVSCVEHLFGIGYLSMEEVLYIERLRKKIKKFTDSYMDEISINQILYGDEE